MKTTYRNFIFLLLAFCIFSCEQPTELAPQDSATINNPSGVGPDSNQPESETKQAAEQIL